MVAPNLVFIVAHTFSLREWEQYEDNANMKPMRPSYVQRCQDEKREGFIEGTYHRAVHCCYIEVRNRILYMEDQVTTLTTPLITNEDNIGFSKG